LRFEKKKGKLLKFGFPNKSKYNMLNNIVDFFHISCGCGMQWLIGLTPIWLWVSIAPNIEDVYHIQYIMVFSM
jgi:hypothetical protein